MTKNYSRLLRYKVAGEHYYIDGHYKIPHPRIAAYSYFVVCSDGEGWDHVSVSLRGIVNNREKIVERCPTWEEMCYIKSLFFNEDEAAVQFHPASSEYVNHHPYCLHLWKPQGITLPIPDSIMVGPK